MSGSSIVLVMLDPLPVVKKQGCDCLSHEYLHRHALIGAGLVPLLPMVENT
jgi:hypothetical protein